MPSLEKRIQDLRTSFTPAQARIADYLVGNTLNAALLTATELAQQVNVDPATVVRLAQKLGYAGYLELKAELAQMIMDPTSTTPIGSLGQALEHSYRSLSAEFKSLWEITDRSELIPFVEWMAMPSRMLLLSDPNCLNTARWLAMELQDRGFNVDLPGADPEALGESLLGAVEYDRALIFEGPLPSPTLEHIAQELQRKRIRSLAILGSPASPLRYQVDSALQLPLTKDLSTYTTTLQLLLMTILNAVQNVQRILHDKTTSIKDPSEVLPAKKDRK